MMSFRTSSITPTKTLVPARWHLYTGSQAPLGNPAMEALASRIKQARACWFLVPKQSLGTSRQVGCVGWWAEKRCLPYLALHY
jgi:hypothetical protein